MSFCLHLQNNSFRSIASSLWSVPFAQPHVKLIRNQLWVPNSNTFNRTWRGFLGLQPGYNDLKSQLQLQEKVCEPLGLFGFLH